MMKKVITPILFILLLLTQWLLGAEPNPRPAAGLGKGAALDPVLNRARGYMSKGELQFATHNYGSFIEFDDKSSPSGLYKGYQYISDVSFILGVPGRDADGARTPWSMRPAYVPGLEFYREDTLVYWGSTVSESWFDRVQDKKQVDWESAANSYGYLHSGDVLAGQIYGGIYTDSGDPYPLLASSDIPDTWPMRINTATGLEERTWPGDWAVVTDQTSPAYGQEIVGRHIGDQDIYMEFDDRLATRDEDMTQGYPMGMHITVNAHSYGRSYAEDIAFFTVQIVNQSYQGFPLDTNGDEIPDVVWMPITHSDSSVTYEFLDRNFVGYTGDLGDGSHYGFDYQEAFGGFYFDVDSYSRLENGQYTGRTNDDDMMAFDTTYDMGFIWDWDDRSTNATHLAYSALKLLDTPKASEDLDINGDGAVDIHQGESLGLTDWHWFDWYKRPGVLHDESATSSCSNGYAGAAGCPGAADKEDIMYALMAGDTAYTGLNNRNYQDWEWRGLTSSTPNPLNASYDDWYFHPALDGTINPHFDSLEGLLNDYPDGLDCVFMMSAGPFDLAAGDTTYFSFAVIMGDPPNNTETFDTPPDLAKNAEMAQIMYDLKYQGFSPPDAPTVSAVGEDGQVSLYWDSKAEASRDVVTGVPDFEGYKIYRSTDGGLTWGNPHTDVIYNTDGQAVGWKPLAQFDLTKDEEEARGYRTDRDYSGPDPVAPWFSLGTDSGLEHRYIDHDVINGVTYSYSVVAYDIGIDSVGYYTNQNPANPWDPLESLENFRGNSALLPQFVTVTPDARPSNAPTAWEIKRADWTIGTGAVEVIPTNPDEVEVNSNTYFISIQADPECFSSNCDNPYYHQNPTYTVVDSATGDTVLSGLDLGISTMFSDVWGGFQFYLENQENPSLDTVYWVGKKPSESPAYHIGVGYPSVRYASNYELRWDWEHPNDDFANRDLPFRVFNTSFGEDLNGNGLLDDGEDLNGNGSLDSTRQVHLLVSGAGVAGSSPDDNYPYFRSGGKVQFREDEVLGYDLGATNINTWFITYRWDTTGVGQPNARHARTGEVTRISINKPYEDGDQFTFRATSVSNMNKVTVADLEKVIVVPNPYIVSADWETDINHKSLHFTHLPNECVIKVFTLAGELVYTILHNDIFSGQEAWNLRSMNRQEVAPGLYVFVVETPNQAKYVGKFAVIR